MRKNLEVIGYADESLNAELIQELFVHAHNQVLRSLIEADDRQWEAQRPVFEHEVREVKQEPVRRSWNILSLVRP